MDDMTKQHWATLLNRQQEAEASYDRTLLTLSSGALALSLVFTKQFVGAAPACPKLLLASWLCWGLSLAVTLFSHYFSGVALTHALKDLADPDQSNVGTPQPFDIITKVLNPLGGLLFLGGLFCFIAFAFYTVR